MTRIKIYTIQNGKFQLEKTTKDIESLQEVVLNLLGKDIRPENIILTDGYDLNARLMDRIVYD